MVRLGDNKKASINIEMLTFSVTNQEHLIESSRLWGKYRGNYSLFFKSLVEIWGIFHLRNKEKVSKKIEMLTFLRTHQGDLTDESGIGEKIQKKLSIFLSLRLKHV
jgi:hypothetical protein